MSTARLIAHELRRHAPFTACGSASGALIMLALWHSDASRDVFERLFWTLHPLHVLLSALVTTAMYHRHAPGKWWRLLLIGYLGSVGIGTISDALIPYAGEWLLNLPHRGLHIGFIEKWWLVNPLALVGIAIGAAWPHTRVPHAGHVLLSAWASLFHMMMAMGGSVSLLTAGLILGFVFLAVWVPCCTSDIIFPLLFVPAGQCAGSCTSLTDNT
jgi:hypothetical protein